MKKSFNQLIFIFGILLILCLTLVSAATCRINNEIVPCDQFWGQTWWVFLVIMPLFFLVGLAFLIFWILMIVDCIKRKFPNENDKILWILVIILTSWIGALIYYFVVKRKK